MRTFAFLSSSLPCLKSCASTMMHSPSASTRTLHRKYASVTEHQPLIPPQRRLSDVSTASERSDCNANHACSRRASVADLVKTYETNASALRPSCLPFPLHSDNAKNWTHEEHDDAGLGAERSPIQTPTQDLDRQSDSDTLALALSSIATLAALESAVMDSCEECVMRAANVPLPDDAAPAPPGILEQFRLRIDVTLNQLRRPAVRFLWRWILQPLLVILLKELISTHVIGPSNTTTTTNAAAADPYYTSLQQAQRDFAAIALSAQTSNLWCLPSYSWWPNPYHVPSTHHPCPEVDIWSEASSYTYQILWPTSDVSLPIHIRDSWAHTADDYLKLLRQAGHLVRITAMHHNEGHVAQAVFANVTYAEAKLRKLTTTTITDISSASDSLLDFFVPGRILGFHEQGGGEEEDYFGLTLQAREQLIQAFWALHEGFRTVIWVETRF
ncbi:uncharacterized protein MYCFIDRAFT_200816 [Pseudocercospora fijiensis CIRAD86]|uniref:Uncharacterized protein n=1 Tax=Pseudocercospora fijiensis (strain CIRAD86) TaxID=383855 RepID=M2ZD41_PSEFD|nr:uncharacterized protein MYCFIDRAFT_200816 [Pseudocercospora fijiensis CIRAD86]EME77039.1 hypothetical protein MYCFIDRAFT_200816 [Pseudocercospora fijiensis CIRAD86]